MAQTAPTNRKKIMVPTTMSKSGWALIEARDDVEGVEFVPTIPKAEFHKIEAEILRVLLASVDQEVKVIPSADPAAPWPDPPGGGPHFDSDDAVRRAIATAMQSADPKQKMDLLRGLASRVSDRFLDETTKPGRDTRDYEMCQVMWGTKYERAGARKPDPDDTTVILPPEKP